jgi:hypothetical protein
MYGAVVLDIGAFADGYRGHISSYHRAVPDAGIVFYVNISNDRGCRRNKDIVSNDRLVVFVAEYHNFVL